MPERETFNHIYFDCPTTSKLLALFSDKYLDPNFSQAERVKAIFFGLTNLGDRDDILYYRLLELFLSTVSGLVNFGRKQLVSLR